MSRTRKFDGFSLVEMMLLLIVVSLMIASGVSVISKKHVKVPRIAMHGAYMCYYNKQGKLHEEKYVGAGVAKKIWDENVDVCRFVPPDRASYFYVQAVAGGGAGGESGYNPKANRRVEKSAVEVISPFGITDKILELKGINKTELQQYGGTLYAYARGDGEYGDAGNGGDLYYIKKETGNCFAYRDWSSEKSSPKTKTCDSGAGQKTVYYGECVEKYNYTTRESLSNSKTCNSYDDYWWNYPNVTNFHCTDDYWTTAWEYGCPGGSGTYSDPCETGSWNGHNWSCYDTDSTSSYCWWSRWWGRTTPGGSRSWHDYCYGGSYDSPCETGTKTVAYGEDDTQSVSVSCWSYTSDSYCVESRYSYRKYQDGVCGSCWWDQKRSDECRFTYNEPMTAKCTPTFENVVVHGTVTYSGTSNSATPPLFVQKKESSYTFGPNNAKIREIKLNDEISASICNYGNSNAYGLKPGIFGSCVINADDSKFEDCDFTSCRATSVEQAFGPGATVLGEASTTISTTKTVDADQKVFKDHVSEVNGGNFDGVWYNRVTEENGLSAFGELCDNKYNSSDSYAACKPVVNNSTEFDSPLGTNYDKPNTEYLQTGCIITESYNKDTYSNYSTNYLYNNGPCNNSWRDNYSKTFSCNPTAKSKTGFVEAYTCEDKTYRDKSCVFGVEHIENAANSNTSLYGHLYGYIIDVVEGEEGGKGTKCRVSAGANTDLQYKGWSSIVPGLSGSDDTTSSVNAYKAVWCASCAGNWPTWLNQTVPFWAESGSDSVGSAHVEIGTSNSCDIHADQAPEGGYGACLQPSKDKQTIINETGGNVSAYIPIAYPGVEHVACKYEPEVSKDSGLCTHQWPQGTIPSWCKPGDSRYPGCKNKNKDGTCSGVGCGSSAPSGCEPPGGSFVGYCLKPFRGDIRPFGKYTYEYTWSTNNLAYGDPGTPGEYKSMIVRSFKDRDMIVIPGKGGAVSGCTGDNGDDTLIYSVPRDAEVEDSKFVTDVVGAELMLQVEGGRGGGGCHTTTTERLPYHFTEPFPAKGIKGDLGKSPTFDNRSNVMGMVLPLDTSILGKWIQSAGAAGDGGGSQNNFWVSSWERKFEGQLVYGDIGEWSEEYLERMGYLDRGYAIPATPGIAGAVLIKW